MELQSQGERGDNGNEVESRREKKREGGGGRREAGRGREGRTGKDRRTERQRIISLSLERLQASRKRSLPRQPTGQQFPPTGCTVGTEGPSSDLCPAQTLGMNFMLLLPQSSRLKKGTELSLVGSCKSQGGPLSEVMAEQGLWLNCPLFFQPSLGWELPGGSSWPPGGSLLLQLPSLLM